MTWERYEGAVAGDLRVLRGELDRDLLVWLPSSYADGDRAYPVLYLHDAQNLFDVATSNGAEWEVDETLERLAGEGVELIAVGVPHQGDRRSFEYADEGLADYVAFLVDEVKPRVDDAFRTGEPTGIGGSSLGGYASLYALFTRPDVFQRALVMSPAFWWDRAKITRVVEAGNAPGARIWMDVGGREHEEETIRLAYLDGHAQMTELLRAKGFDDETLRSVVDDDAGHHETAWAARLPDAIRFLFGA